MYLLTWLVAALCRLSPIYKKKFQPGSHHPDLSQKLPNFALIFPPICIYNLGHVDNSNNAMEVDKHEAISLLSFDILRFSISHMWFTINAVVTHAQS